MMKAFAFTATLAFLLSSAHGLSLPSARTPFRSLKPQGLPLTRSLGFDTSTDSQAISKSLEQRKIGRQSSTRLLSSLSPENWYESPSRYQDRIRSYSPYSSYSGGYYGGYSPYSSYSGGYYPYSSRRGAYSPVSNWYEGSGIMPDRREDRYRPYYQGNNYWRQGYYGGYSPYYRGDNYGRQGYYNGGYSPYYRGDNYGRNGYGRQGYYNGGYSPYYQGDNYGRNSYGRSGYYGGYSPVNSYYGSRGILPDRQEDRLRNDLRRYDDYGISPYYQGDNYGRYGRRGYSRGYYPYSSGRGYSPISLDYQGNYYGRRGYSRW